MVMFVISSDPSFAPVVSPVAVAISRSIGLSSSPVTSFAVKTGASMTASVKILAVSLAEAVSPFDNSVAVAVTVKPVKSASLSAGGENVGPPSNKTSPAGNVNVQTPVAASNVPPLAVVSTAHVGSIPEMLTVSCSDPSVSFRPAWNASCTEPSSLTKASATSTKGSSATAPTVTFKGSVTVVSLFVKVTSPSTIDVSVAVTVTESGIEPLKSVGGVSVKPTNSACVNWN